MNASPDANINDNKRSAALKLQLLINGLRFHHTAVAGLGQIYKEYQYGYNDTNWLNDEIGSLIPSELVLPGGIVVAPHFRPDSPYIIRREAGSLCIIHEPKDEIVSHVEYLPRPAIWDMRLSNGMPIKKYFNIYGSNCLNLFAVSRCEFWDTGQPCSFCSLKPAQAKHGEVIIKKELALIDEAARIAFASDDSIAWMIITGGSMIDRKSEVDRYCAILEIIAHHMPSKWKGKIRGNLALLPTNDQEDLERIFACGIEHPSFNLEVWGNKRFELHCPGKATHAPLPLLLDAYQKSVKIWGPGEVWCNFVGGITPLDELKSGMRQMADLGVTPGANIFHIDPGAPAVKQGHQVPDQEYILGLYSFLAELYHEYAYRPFFDHTVLRNSLSNEMYNGWL